MLRKIPLVFYFFFPMVFFIVSAVVFLVSAASPDTGLDGSVDNPNPYVESIKLIKLGDVNGASRVFQKSFQGNWSGELEQLIRIAELREKLDRERSAVKWSIMADELQDYFVSYQMWNSAVNIAKARFLRFKAVHHALDVIDIYLQADWSEQALLYADYLRQKFQGDAESLMAIEVTKVQIYLACGLPEHARHTVRQIRMQKIDSPEILMQLAKVQSATRQYASAVKTLIRCFELTSPSVLPAYKVDAGSSEEFKPIMASSEFILAMATQSTLTDNCPACAKKWNKIAINETKPVYRMADDNININDWRIK